MSLISNINRLIDILFGMLLGSIISFAFSVYSNHMYLTQKKEIRQMQLLKDIPPECLLGANDRYDWWSTFLGVIYGHTPTSPHCLEVAEALYLTAKQHNVFESIIYTLSECSRHVGKGLGQLFSETFDQLGIFQTYFLLFPFLFFCSILLCFCLNSLSRFILQFVTSKRDEENNQRKNDQLILFLLDFYVKNQNENQLETINSNKK